ncbi:MAG: hypothetical protein J1E62_07135 [Lachnospiraceae bacterium]|nr:hypothetical protein [Lachnospiraceae bacterium]
MYKTITDYFKKRPIYNEKFSDVCSEIKDKFNEGSKPVLRESKTSTALFEKEFGYKLPDEIDEYINLFWHAYIYGYCLNAPECIVLFSVLKKEGDSDNDILFYSDGLITISHEWEEIGDIQKYIPIGWLGYSGAWVLYEVKSGKIFLEDVDSGIDGVIGEQPIADSLCELISKLEKHAQKLK